MQSNYNSSRSSYSRNTNKGDLTFAKKKLDDILGTPWKQNIVHFKQLPKDTLMDFDKRTRTLVEHELISVSGTQIRKLFDMVIRCRTLQDCMLRIPRIAYIIGKAEGRTQEPLKILFYLYQESVYTATDDAQVTSIQGYMEALVAYHRFFGSER